jgi:hypothetical protein
MHSTADSASPASAGSLDERLEALAITVAGHSSTPGDWIDDLAHQLCAFARESRENYELLLPPEGETPTAAQGVALARFLRSRFGERCGQATITRGGLGLPDHFVHVLFPDGYQGGIDREGNVST